MGRFYNIKKLLQLHNTSVKDYRSIEYLHFCFFETKY